MRQIRKSVFETNSSSTHSICISKQQPTSLPASVYFGLNEYGWENDAVYDTASYLYTALWYMFCNGREGKSEFNEKLDKIKEILNKHNIEYYFQNPEDDDYYYVDHCGELLDLINELLNNEDKLLRYLFGDSVIYTGNDNSNDEEDMCYAASETIYDYDNNTNYPNPNHNTDRYEYYFKGN